MFDLSKKTAIITGATRGIGRSIAEQMALQGARVVVSSRKPEACDAVAKQINEMVKDGSGEALPISCNIAHKDQLRALVDKSIQHYGQVDILVCNASVNVHHGLSATISDDAFDHRLDLLLITHSTWQFRRGRNLAPYPEHFWTSVLKK